MWDSIFEEFIIRQMFWIFHSDENKEKMKKIFDPIIDIISKDEKFIDTLIIGRENVKE